MIAHQNTAPQTSYYFLVTAKRLWL